MKEQILLSDIVSYLETQAPLALQESYDNTGLQTGEYSQIIHAALLTIDVTEEILQEAIEKKANLIITHHPLIFGGLKRITGSSVVEKIVIKAIRNHIAILAVHTNLDNAEGGVNAKLAEKLGLSQCRILQPLKGKLRKLVTFVPSGHISVVRQAIFDAGAGHIGNYDQCSFNLEGCGTFRGNDHTNPFAGEPGKMHTEKETRLETIYPEWLEPQIIAALMEVHPYEEVAYDIYSLENSFGRTGAGMVGILPAPVDEEDFLKTLKGTFRIPVIRHSPLLNKPVSRVAICGGAGSFLLKDAVSAGADFFISGDIKYHQFFDPAGKIVMADIGHYESEQFTKELFYELLTKKFPTFAVHLSEVNTNPVSYYM
jgi:dinuclear metal center YbgI/SA1388 family protein